MALQQWKRFTDSEILVFGKLLHHSIQRRLLSLQKRMILITAYRPSEMWGDQPPDTEVLNSFESIIVQARTFESDLRRLGYEGQVFTLPLLPPEAEEPKAWPANSWLQIGFLGRLVPDKNVEYLIVSFSHLREMGIEAQLHLFGGGSEQGALQACVNKMKLTDCVRFHGNLDHGQIASAIDQCHMFAFSSRTEGQCLAALEILARGRPVLGTPVGAFPEYLHGRLGSIAPLDNPAGFAAALKTIAEPILHGEVTPADVQQAYVSRFQRRHVIDGYLQVFSCSVSAQREMQTG
jgi:glycosyltransferase involved in cell wall biosynthesis